MNTNRERVVFPLPESTGSLQAVTESHCGCRSSWVSVKEAAVYFDCHTDTVRKAMKGMTAIGMDGIRHVGSRYKIHLQQMDDYFRDRAKHELSESAVGMTSGPECRLDSDESDEIPRTWR